MSQKQRLLAEGTVTMTGSNIAIPLATKLPGDNRQNGVTVHVYAASGNSAVVRLVKDGSASAGIVLAAGGSIALADHQVSDTALYVLGTASDTIEYAVYGADNPSV